MASLDHIRICEVVVAFIRLQEAADRRLAESRKLIHQGRKAESQEYLREACELQSQATGMLKKYESLRRAGDNAAPGVAGS